MTVFDLFQGCQKTIWGRMFDACDSYSEPHENVRCTLPNLLRPSGSQRNTVMCLPGSSLILRCGVVNFFASIFHHIAYGVYCLHNSTYWSLLFNLVSVYFHYFIEHIEIIKKSMSLSEAVPKLHSWNLKNV